MVNVNLILVFLKRVKNRQETPQLLLKKIISIIVKRKKKQTDYNLIRKCDTAYLTVTVIRAHPSRILLMP